jgi:hypothetical protein
VENPINDLPAEQQPKVLERLALARNFVGTLVEILRSAEAACGRPGLVPQVLLAGKVEEESEAVVIRPQRR